VQHAVGGWRAWRLARPRAPPASPAIAPATPAGRGRTTAPNPNRAPRRTEYRSDVTMGQCALDGKHRGGRLRGHAALEQDTEVLDELWVPVREVGQRALDDVAVLAIALAQQDGWRRSAVGDGLDVTAYIAAVERRIPGRKNPNYMATLLRREKVESRTNARSAASLVSRRGLVQGRPVIQLRRAVRPRTAA
jgi:hypothetical protein